MLIGTPYLTLIDPANRSRSFTYVQHPDGVSVNILFRDQDGTMPIGPWHRDTAKRHATYLRAAGYIPHRPDPDFLTRAALFTAPSPQGVAQ
jgi:hypothetical protein